MSWAMSLEEPDNDILRLTIQTMQVGSLIDVAQLLVSGSEHGMLDTTFCDKGVERDACS